MTAFRAACLQVNATNDMAANIDAAAALALKARAAGADFAQLPENAVLMTWGRANLIAAARPESEHPALAAFKKLAQETGLWMHIGSLHILLPGDQVANRGFLIDPTGTVRASYDKIHMFDVNLANGESYKESSTFKPGNCAVVADLPWGKLGMTICYDLRFPHLYRSLAKAGADFLAVPAAFTRTTGKAHWHVLLRARAIESGCYVIAAAQTGDHFGNRQTYGHSLIISPWGEVLADAGEEPGFVMAEIDLAKVAEARGMVPALTHDRAYDAPAAAQQAAQ